MFGLHLWARPFLHPTAGGTAPGVEAPTVPRHPAAGFGAPGYLLPHLTAGDKTAASSMPFNPSSLLLYRPGEHYLHPSLLRLNMDAASLHSLHHHSSTERAMHSSLLHQGEEGETYPSAFQPTKRAKLEDVHGRPDSTKGSDSGRYSSAENYSPVAHYNMSSSPGAAGGKHSPAADGRSSAGVRSPDSSSRRPDTADHLSDHDRSSYGPGSPGSELGEGQVRCPVCGIHLEAREMAHHYTQEVEKLIVFFKETGDRIFGVNRDGTLSNVSPGSSSSSGSHESNPSHSMSTSRYETYLKIRGNRHSRLNAKFRVGRRKRASESPSHSVSHPEMNLQLTPPCSTVTKVESMPREDHGPEIDPVSCDNGENEIIVVDRDVPPITSNSSAAENLSPSHHHPSPVHHHSPVMSMAPLDVSTHNHHAPPPPPAHMSTSTVASPHMMMENPAATIAAINSSMALSSPHTSLPSMSGASPFMLMDHRFRLPPGDDMKCHVCGKTYDKPVTSVQCWHTHCEECWLQSLGSKRTCPRCNVVTSPSELRKVYI